MSLTVDQENRSKPSSEEAQNPAVSVAEGTGKERARQEWMMVGVGLTGLTSVLAIIVAIVALSSTNPSTVVTMRPAAMAGSAIAGSGMAGGMSSRMSANGQPGAAASGRMEAVKLVMKSDAERAMKGPDGKYHDAVMPGNFTIQAGRSIRMTIYNYDDMPHTFTATDLGVNQTIPAGSENAPSRTTVTFKAPSTPGKYQWWCALPCDPYSMSTDGLMRGSVTVAA